MDEKAYAIGIDVGGTKTGIALVGISGKIYRHDKFETEAASPDEVLNQIAGNVKEMIKLAPNVVAVGAGVAGQVDQNTGVLLFAPNLNWRNIPFQNHLQQALNLPVSITNDVRAAAWGEWLYGAGKGCNDIACVFVGTGIGGGIISGGRMLNGNSNTLGEVGHMIIDISGLRCTCGSKGCLQTIAGGQGMAKRAQEAIKNDPAYGKGILEAANGKIDQITAKTIIDMSKKNDPLALLLLEDAKQALIAGCASIVNVFNPKRLILGGGIMYAMPEWIPQITKGINNFALDAATADLEVLPSKLREDSNVVGAAAFAFQSQKA